MDTEFFCPVCNGEYEHVILKESDDLLVQCKNCGSVYHMEKVKEPEEIKVKAIISSEKESNPGFVELDDDEMVSVGDLLVAEADDNTFGVEVTSVEIDDKRVRSATACDIDTLWTRSIDNVIVKVSYHDGRKTIPLYLKCNGEDDIVIGEVYEIGKFRFKVTHMKLRNGAMMRKEGWKAYARKIKRVYGIKSNWS
ncbi:putative Zn finger protein [Methanomicrobium sp. W14]|uniref:HVO_0476 family zinc finger protein n=1 Tax=Methanomicrobium sp. W14 TaxID=2817839 RepID=UPI001AE22E4E|nr:HVO_0476 family zinc finger protein [Methanomicrobium sp. W14]MBP2132849.1 putative Zn finger protein [Methanomicrobium sp. W14]